MSKLEHSDRPIGVFDSGVGGLTVVRALRRVLPGEPIVYLGDTARVPYGSKSPATVVKYSQACARFLTERNVKLLLVACNTASAHALGALSGALAVPVVGAVEPGAARALSVTRRGRIGVLGTLGTIRSGAYEVALSGQREGLRVTGQACPLLVPLAEEGWTDDPVTETIATRYLVELAGRDPDIDTLVLGCTHYPLLRTTLERVAARVFGHPVSVVDSAEAMAGMAVERLVAAGASSPPQGGQLTCFVTDDSRVEELAPRFLGEQPVAVTKIDLV